MDYREVNFDGLIGPTHSYAGLSFGNVASAANAGAVSNPREAALQGLAKMRVCLELGLVQGFLPPLIRPDMALLARLGFSGTDRQMLAAAAKAEPQLLANVYSASSMWTANAATIAPSLDSADGKVHLTPANLSANFHRAIEAPQTASNLRQIFAEKSVFSHHDVLPPTSHFGDEGAANHGRLAMRHDAPGVHLFVYGEAGERFPARQAYAASRAVARNHLLADGKAVFIKQSRAALDAGAFHNDVVGVANESVLFLHEQSFEDREAAYAQIRAAAPFVEIVEAPRDQVSLEDAVKSYLFNSQLLTLPSGEMALILPQEAQENARVSAFLTAVIEADNKIAKLVFKDVRESMRNGGGPACLRLRVLLSEQERGAVHPNFLLDDAKIAALESFVRTHYRDRLASEDLADPEFMEEALQVSFALYKQLGLKSVV